MAASSLQPQRVGRNTYESMRLKLHNLNTAVNNASQQQQRQAPNQHGRRQKTIRTHPQGLIQFTRINIPPWSTASGGASSAPSSAVHSCEVLEWVSSEEHCCMVLVGAEEVMTETEMKNETDVVCLLRNPAERADGKVKVSIDSYVKT